MSSALLETLNVVGQASHYNAWIYSQIKRYLSGRVLDIGSGLGDIACQFNDSAVIEVVLSDSDPQMLLALEETQRTLKNSSILSLDIADPQTQEVNCAGSIDTVTCVNVLEHIKDDMTALKHMKHLLRKDGTLVLLVPAIPALYGTLDRYVGHFRRYTKKDLSHKLNEAGFVVKEAYYMNMLGMLTWFLSGRILRQKKFDLTACRFLDKMVPLVRNFESKMRPPFGQSLIIVAKV